MILGSSRCWKRFKLEKVSIVFPPIRSLSFGARRGIYQASYLPPLAIMGFYVITYEEILGISSLHAFGTENKLRRRINLLYGVDEVSIEIRETGYLG